jgi:hypothetical protein
VNTIRGLGENIDSSSFNEDDDSDNESRIVLFMALETQEETSENNEGDYEEEVEVNLEAELISSLIDIISGKGIPKKGQYRIVHSRRQWLGKSYKSTRGATSKSSKKWPILMGSQQNQRGSVIERERCSQR